MCTTANFGNQRSFKIGPRRGTVNKIFFLVFICAKSQEADDAAEARRFPPPKRGGGNFSSLLRERA